MKEISISSILKCINDENNYADDIWNNCLNEKEKRYRRKDISNSLKKLEKLGFIKKVKISSTDTYYKKIIQTNPDDYIGFINDIIFTNESKIKETLKKLEDRKIFLDISKDLVSYKISIQSKKNYEKLLDAILNMTELASSILLVKETSNQEKFKNNLTACFDEIKETLDKTNQKIIMNRKSNEIIILQRNFSGRIPNPGYLKL